MQSGVAESALGLNQVRLVEIADTDDMSFFREGEVVPQGHSFLVEDACCLLNRAGQPKQLRTQTNRMLDRLRGVVYSACFKVLSCSVLCSI